MKILDVLFAAHKENVTALRSLEAQRKKAKQSEEKLNAARRSLWEIIGPPMTHATTSTTRIITEATADVLGNIGEAGIRVIGYFFSALVGILFVAILFWALFSGPFMMFLGLFATGIIFVMFYLCLYSYHMKTRHLPDA